MSYVICADCSNHQIFARLVDLPTVSMLESGEKGSIAPGMHKTVTIVLEEIQVGCQVGGIIFSAEENGAYIEQALRLRPELS